MVEVKSTNINGLFLVNYFTYSDERGKFIKPWNIEDLKGYFSQNLETYISFSKKGTFRGLHYNSNEDCAQTKFISCLQGSIEDISLDLRKDSETYGKIYRHKLTGMSGEGIIIPRGFAHGFFCLDDSMIINFCDNIFYPEDGIHYSSIKELNDLDVSIISEKDKHLPNIKDIL